MRKMKDSGVAWLESIPETWNLLQLGSLFLEHKHKNVGMQSSNLLSLSYGKIIQKNINATDGLLPESFEGYNVIDAGDIVLRLTDLQNDQRSLRVGLCGESGIITSAYTTLRRRNDALNSKYFYYLLHSYDIRKGFYGMGAGVRQGLNYAGVRKIMLTVPPESEQTAIAECLDRKTAQVDALISNVQAQIEKLKAYKQSLITEIVTNGLDPTVPMKDSSVEWIGKMPAHWDINRIKYVSDFAPTCNTDTLTQDSVVAYAPMECIKNGYFERRSARYGSLAHTLTPFQNGDIVMAKVTPCFENGNIAVMKNLDSDYGLGSSELFVFRPRKIFTQYLMYWLQNQLFVRYACATMTGTGGLKRVSPVFVRGCNIHTPPVAEQKEIAAYLDTKCAEIDQLIAVKQSKIEKLEQYKRSLIYEYVTGKKEVS